MTTLKQITARLTETSEPLMKKQIAADVKKFNTLSNAMLSDLIVEAKQRKLDAAKVRQYLKQIQAETADILQKCLSGTMKGYENVADALKDFKKEATLKAYQDSEDAVEKTRQVKTNVPSEKVVQSWTARLTNLKIKVVNVTTAPGKLVFSVSAPVSLIYLSRHNSLVNTVSISSSGIPKLVILTIDLTKD